METKIEQLRAYLENRQAFDITKLEKEAGVPSRSVYRWLKRVKSKGVEATLSNENCDKMVKLLAEKYGLAYN